MHLSSAGLMGFIYAEDQRKQRACLLEEVGCQDGSGGGQSAKWRLHRRQSCSRSRSPSPSMYLALCKETQTQAYAALAGWLDGPMALPAFVSPTT